jgi:hypothetical protein
MFDLAAMEIANKIFVIASGVFGLRDRFKSAKKDRRNAISAYFLKLSETLSRAATSLENGVYPHGDCQAMLTYSQMFSSTIGGVIDPKLAQEWQDALISAHRLESLSQAGQKEREEVIAKLRGSAGMFEAVAYSLRAAA